MGHRRTGSIIDKKNKSQLTKKGYKMDLIINNFSVEITENYEGDRFHVVVFETSETPNEWHDTYHCKNETELIKVLFNLHEERT